MSEQVNLNAENREVEGKSSSRQLRRSGSVPAVIYGGKEDPVRISILEKDIAKASEIPGFATQILNISISGKDQSVIVKEIQRHPATQRVLHADLMRVDPDTKISISVPMRFINEESCVGVKMHGGAISRLINDIDITCLASNLPVEMQSTDPVTKISPSTNTPPRIHCAVGIDPDVPRDFLGISQSGSSLVRDPTINVAPA